ncbi:peptidyl-dipeptidase Dcp Metallo peptidase. MEROPS family M03A [Pseudobacteriovorax antillogorgiicola]|uniref:Peptidyl-dipeptidase Dcp Metallo peptidase. MEROPS family M03A n=1 Tax=Pseudobacteriovorax antillogorgiicola TaxID=1513793 RepID=A0A1Y6BAS9_9BACT|nr:M3 family metallopeptidase [Pseudobacteriovorax antillogorgiicola]TCS57477.1 peptidyl-dipeptidase Dcp [Pseudobacteriovorax antillogorgiicola]SMF00572.1 peptidyl-dipeptidase Dcp Metallo peptidase. MEROPS family M03A [Pseudobacteriovorax antillogorgiicola]
MQRKKHWLAIAAATYLSSCATTEKQVIPATGSEQIAQNTLIQEWQGPYQGVPAFDKMNLDDLMPAFDYLTAQHLERIDMIASNSKAPTFENTIVALEKADRDMGRLFTYYGIWAANKSSPEFRNIQRQLVPKLSAYNSKITQNQKLFDRVKAVHESKAVKQMGQEEQRLVSLVYDRFARNGATLNSKDKERFAAINRQLAELYVQFGNNILADEENYILYLKKDQLSGLPESFVKSASAIAEKNGKPGLYAITNTRSSMDPFLRFSTERALREKVWNNYYNRGDNNDENDNNQIISQILKLRHERVQLLGYKNFASWRLENRMAKTPEQAEALLLKVWPAAINRVEEEVRDMQAIADAEKANIKIKPWDYRFYAEKVRLKKYDIDSNEVKKYLQLDNLTDAMFYVAGRLFDFRFTPVKEGSVPVFHPDVNVWEVTKISTDEHVGLWYLDPYARPGKRSGAWATSYRSHTNMDGKATNVLSSNNSNFVKAAPGEPILVSWDDANTFFHEFGHALHFLASNVKYPTLNGGVRDYTEFQSQLLERWLLTDEVINRYLKHYKTGKPMPASLIKKIKQASNFNQGFGTTEYLASAIIDLKLHTTDPEGIDPRKFEKETLAGLGMPEELVMRHRTPHFGHVFSGEGYAAGYYGYLWAEVLTSDAAEAFQAAPGGFYDKDLGQRLVKYLFAPRNAIDPNEAYRLFRGKDPKAESLMRDRGFIDSH